MTQQEWGGVVSNMIGRGAQVSDAEFDEVVEYLSKTFPPGVSAVTGTSNGVPAPKPVHKHNMIDEAGATDKQVVDDEAAERGRAVYAAQCVNCHGTHARGSSRGPDLVRSVVILHDRYGSTLAPYLTQSHPTKTPFSLTQDQMLDLTHFLHQQVGDTLRTGPNNHPLNILVGDATAGKTYFFGQGKCSTCHSPTGDLAHIAARYDPPSLQLKVVFPENRAVVLTGSASPRKPVTVTVTTASGESVTGEPTSIDDFNVSIRDEAGQYHSFARGPGVRVEKHNPYATHQALLDEYTDKQIHDVVAYLETLQ